MGCAGSTGNFGPITKLDLNELEERDSDLDILDENEFPYMSGRLKEIDWQAIIEKGEPWEDETFPRGPECLFINNRGEIHRLQSSLKRIRVKIEMVDEIQMDESQ